jgi:hypothetical protein
LWLISFIGGESSNLSKPYCLETSQYVFHTFTAKSSNQNVVIYTGYIATKKI